jgi:hypothetical protein
MILLRNALSPPLRFRKQARQARPSRRPPSAQRSLDSDDEYAADDRSHRGRGGAGVSAQSARAPAYLPGPNS